MGAGKDAVVEFVNAINANDEVKGMLKNWVKNACYKLEGEDGPFWVEHKADGSAEFHDGEPDKAHFTFIGPTQIWADISTGKEDAQKAFFAKKYKIEGDVMGTMKLLPVIKKLQT
ncbi:MAG: SCP2 sterol-binding domain-containing protein [Candidatus Heimdallarchaeota archaeon]|nr:MAG: SCP2 sterol-binding domain-containing protein [Candidatus Heimdallarchaeota archaeon]